MSRSLWLDLSKKIATDSNQTNQKDTAVLKTLENKTMKLGMQLQLYCISDSIAC